MEIGFGGMDSGFQGAVKSLDSHFAKADALLQVGVVLFRFVSLAKRICSGLRIKSGSECCIHS
jgi:hypothetical protein